MSLPDYSSSESNDDGDITPRQPHFDHITNIPYNVPPPPYGTPATENDPLLRYEEYIGGGERDWRGSRPQLRHIPPPPESEEGSSQEGNESDRTVRRRSVSQASSSESEESSLPDIDLNEWKAWIEVWLLTCLVVVTATAAVVVIWLLVTQ